MKNLILFIIVSSIIIQGCNDFGYDDKKPSSNQHEPTVFQEIVSGSFSIYYNYEENAYLSCYSYFEEQETNELKLISDTNVSGIDQKDFWSKNPKKNQYFPGEQWIEYPFYPSENKTKQIAFICDSITNDTIAIAVNTFSSLEDGFMETLFAVSLEDSLIVDLNNINNVKLKIYFSLTKINALNTGKNTVNSKNGLTYDLKDPVIETCEIEVKAGVISHDDKFSLESKKLIIYRGHGKIAQLVKIEKTSY